MITLSCNTLALARLRAAQLIIRRNYTYYSSLSSRRISCDWPIKLCSGSPPSGSISVIGQLNYVQHLNYALPPSQNSDFNDCVSEIFCFPLPQGTSLQVPWEHNASHEKPYRNSNGIPWEVLQRIPWEIRWGAQMGSTISDRWKSYRKHHEPYTLMHIPRRTFQWIYLFQI